MTDGIPINHYYIAAIIWKEYQISKLASPTAAQVLNITRVMASWYVLVHHSTPSEPERFGMRASTVKRIEAALGRKLTRADFQ